MGQYRIIINATGGHGCQREKSGDDTLETCSNANCPDCFAREFVATLRSRGEQVSEATLHHWPGQASEVVDNLLTGKRLGKF